MKVYSNCKNANSILDELSEKEIIGPTDTVELLAGINEKACLLLTDQYLIYASINNRNPNKDIVLKKKYDDISINNIWKDKWLNIEYRDEGGNISFKGLYTSPKETEEIRGLIMDRLYPVDKEHAKDKEIISLEGKCKGKKCIVQLDGKIITIRISKLFNLSEDIYRSKITDIVIFTNKSSGLIAKGILGIGILRDNKVDSLRIEYQSASQDKIDKIIDEYNSYLSEIELICNQCGDIYYFNEGDLRDARNAALMDISKGLLALGGHLPLAFLPDKQVSDLKRCRKCGSRNVQMSEVIHKMSNYHDI